MPLIYADEQGALQAGASVGAAVLTTQGLKRLFPEVRPDGSNNRSFPSGHTSIAFSAAASILERRGQSEGIPAFALASFVGIARVEANKHFWYDAAAGAAIGSVSGLLITHRPGASDAVIPWGDAHSAGVIYAVRF